MHIHTYTYIYTHIHPYTSIYIHIHTYTYIYIHIHTYTSIYIHIHTYTYIYIHIHTYTSIYIHIHPYTYIYIHIHTYTYIYIHIHTYTSIYQWSTKMFAACRRSFFCLQILPIWKACRDENGSLSVSLKVCRAYERSEPHSRSEYNSSWGVWGRCNPPPPHQGVSERSPEHFWNFALQNTQNGPFWHHFIPEIKLLHCLKTSNIYS